MAYNDSGTMQANTPYNLGDYQFNCVFDDSGSMGTRAQASMKKDGQTVYKSVSIPNSAIILGYTVEANESEATVYAHIKSQAETPIPVEIPQAGTVSLMWGTRSWSRSASPYSTLTAWYADPEPHHGISVIRAASSPVAGERNYQYTYNGKTVYYADDGNGFIGNEISDLSPNFTEHKSTYTNGAVAWAIVYGSWEEKEEEIIVGRFAIDLGDAGGYPGGGGAGCSDDGGGGDEGYDGDDWDEPGDWDEEWEPGDPYKTLHVEVTGATSGRHNDPLNDTSYSYVPSEKSTVKKYGCGGDGGHGGGGGAGASTVIVHRLATNQANSHEVTALARRHGYGSGGGKGGKGGDGIVLIYY